MTELHVFDNNNDGSAYSLVQNMSNEELVSGQLTFGAAIEG